MIITVKFTRATIPFLQFWFKYFVMFFGEFEFFENAVCIVHSIVSAFILFKYYANSLLNFDIK